MNTKTFISPIKRQQIKKQQEAELKKYMRTSLPVHDWASIRRHRLPYHAAVLLDLNEGGFIRSQKFIWEMIQYQEGVRAQQGKDSPLSLKPRLMKTVEEIDVLQNALKNSEKAYNEGDIGKQIDILLKLSIHLGFQSSDWWWLADHVFEQAVQASCDYMNDGGKKQAIVNYLYGKFLLENLKLEEKAKQFLVEARQISTGQKWTATADLNCKQDSVFNESCNLLYHILMSEAKETMIEDPEAAARICSLAEKRALDACNRNAQADAVLLQGLCTLDAGDSNEALKLFRKALMLYTNLNHKEGICETQINVALAFLKLGKFEETKANLEMLMEYAQKENLMFYVAQANRFLGEFYLNHGNPHMATPLLLTAAQIYDEIDDKLNMEQVKNMAAVSAGQELFPKYVNLILGCGKPDSKGSRSVMKLVGWKDDRELFWSDTDIVEPNTNSIKSILQFINDEDIQEHYQIPEPHLVKKDLKRSIPDQLSEEKVIRVVDMDSSIVKFPEEDSECSWELSFN